MDSLGNSRVLRVGLYAGGKRLDLSGYHVYLNSIDATNTREPNTANISVYNLGPANRGLLSSEHEGLEVIGGYANPGGLFRGQTISVTHKPPNRNQPHWETVIVAGDSVKEFRYAWVSISRNAGAPVSSVFSDIGDAMGLSVDCRITGRIDSPWAFNGRCSDALTELCEDLGAQWQIFGGTVEVLPVGGSVERTTQTAVLLSRDAGMVGSPELIDYGSLGKKRKYGVAAKSLLNPALRPNGLVKIVSADGPGPGLVRGKKRTYTTPGVNGLYRIERVSHFGSLRSVEFYTDVTTEAFKF